MIKRIMAIFKMRVRTLQVAYRNAKKEIEQGFYDDARR